MALRTASFAQYSTTDAARNLRYDARFSLRDGLFHSRAVLNGGFATPPPFPFESVFPTLSTRPVTSLRMGSFTVLLEVTSLPEVLATIGAGHIGFHGDAAAADSWICYTLDDAEPKKRLWIVSNAEMGGPEQYVGEIVAQVKPSAKATLECPTLPEAFQPLSFDHSIWLSESEHSVRSALGAASKAISPWLEYSYAGKTPGSCSPDGFDVTNALVMRLEHERIVEIFASQVTSC